MSGRGEEREWRKKLSSEGAVYSLNSQTDYTGHKIFFDPNIETTSVSSYFLAKWRNANSKLQGLINNGTILTTISVGGSHYPIYTDVTQGFLPLILGKDFFHAYNWQCSN